MEIYQVGGAVRDKLLGRPIKDRDWVVVGATPKRMEELGYRRVGNDFPVYLHPETKEEYALARTERKTGPGYQGFSFDTDPTVTLEDDLKRRDLTINAMALTEDGRIIDPFNGQKDLAEKRLKHVSDAFEEDPLRVLRVCRFASRYDFQIAPETLVLMQRISKSGELTSLTSERVWQEIHRALAEDHPDIFLRTMRSCDALQVLLPEVACLFGIPQPETYHPEIDTGEHICLALRQCVKHQDNEQIRFAVLVHDVGKGVTPQEQWPSHSGHESLGLDIVDSICDRFKVPKNYRNLAKAVTANHLRVHRVLETRASKQLSLLNDLDAWRRRDRFENILSACRADATGRTGKTNDDYPQAAYLSRVRDELSKVSTKELVERKLDNETFSRELNRIRLDRLEAFISLASENRQ